MRRYSFYITILLSLLLPLHAAASIWLSAPVCSMEAAVADAADHTTKNASEEVVSEEVVHDCCDDSDDMDCTEMQTCYGCNINCHLFSLLTPAFIVPVERTLHPTFNPPSLALFDPATVWRPPTNS